MKYFFCILIFIFFAGFVDAKEKPFIWADDQDYAPYIFLDLNGKAGGVFHDIMSAAFAQMGKEFQNQLYPWKRAQALVAGGHADGMITIPTDKRLESLIASDPLIVSEMKVHFNTNNVDSKKINAINQLSELKDYTLIDYIGDGWAESNLSQHDVVWAPNYTSAILMVAVNRGDIFLNDPISIKFHIKKQIEVTPELTEILQQVKRGEHSIVSTSLCLLVRKNSVHASMIGQFNLALKEIKANGKYQKIIDKYLN